MTAEQARAEMTRIQALPDTKEHEAAKYIRYWELGEIWIAGLKANLSEAS